MNRVLSLFISIIDIILFLLLLLMIYNVDLGLAGISLIAIIISIYIIVSIKFSVNNSVITLIFLIVYAVSIFGRAFLQYKLSYIPTTSSFDSLRMFSTQAIYQALVLGITSMLGIHVGILLTNYNKTNLREKRNISDTANNKYIFSIKMTAKLLLLISIVPAIIIFISEFIGIALPGGLSTTLKMMEGWLLIYFIINIVVNKSANHFWLGLFYYFPQLLWGARGEPIIYVVILYYLYNRFINKKTISFIKGIILAIVTVLILNLFVVIKDYRNIELSQWFANIPQIYFDTLVNSNPILEIIYEVGVALAPTVAAIQITPEILPVQFGKTFLYSIFTAIPDFLRIRPGFMTELGNMPAFISNYYGAAFGGSILQDFYVNFMWLSPLIMVVVGFLIQKFSEKISIETNEVKIVFLSVFLYPLFWWPRSSIGFFFRNIFVTVFIPLLVYLLCLEFYKKLE